MKNDVDIILDSIRVAVARGVIDAAGEIRRQAVKATPVDTGNLRRSAEIAVDGNTTHVPAATNRTRKIVVRYTAPYAGYVHDASGRGRGKPRRPPHRGKYWDPPGSRPKYLLLAVEAVNPRLEAYIKRRVNEVIQHG